MLNYATPLVKKAKTKKEDLRYVTSEVLIFFFPMLHKPYMSTIFTSQYIVYWHGTFWCHTWKLFGFMKRADEINVNHCLIFTSLVLILTLYVCCLCCVCLFTTTVLWLNLWSINLIGVVHLDVIVHNIFVISQRIF